MNVPPAAIPKQPSHRLELASFPEAPPPPLSLPTRPGAEPSLEAYSKCSTLADKRESASELLINLL